jgi:hypothetical protein
LVSIAYFTSKQTKTASSLKSEKKNWKMVRSRAPQRRGRSPGARVHRGDAEEPEWEPAHNEQQYRKEATGFYNDGAIVETVFRKPKAFADLHEYDDVPDIDRVPTAVGFHSLDSAESFNDEKSRLSRYDYELDREDELDRREVVEKDRQRQQRDDDDFDDNKYSKRSPADDRSVWSESSDSCPPVWTSYSDEQSNREDWATNKKVNHRPRDLSEAVIPMRKSKQGDMQEISSEEQEFDKKRQQVMQGRKYNSTSDDHYHARPADSREFAMLVKTERVLTRDEIEREHPTTPGSSRSGQVPVRRTERIISRTKSMDERDPQQQQQHKKKEYVKTDSVKSGSAKNESAKSASIRSSSVKKGSIRKESAKNDSVKRASAKIESAIRSRSVKRGSIEKESAKTDSVKSGSTRSSSVKRGSIRKESAKTDSVKSGSAKNESVKSASTRSSSVKRGSIRKEFAKNESVEVKSGSAKTASARSSLVKRGSIRKESAKTIRKESVKSIRKESAKTDSVKSGSTKTESVKSGSTRSAKNESVKSASTRNSLVKRSWMAPGGFKRDTAHPETEMKQKRSKNTHFRSWLVGTRKSNTKNVEKKNSSVSKPKEEKPVRYKKTKDAPLTAKAAGKQTKRGTYGKPDPTGSVSSAEEKAKDEPEPETEPDPEPETELEPEPEPELEPEPETETESESEHGPEPDWMGWGVQPRNGTDAIEEYRDGQLAENQPPCKEPEFVAGLRSYKLDTLASTCMAGLTGLAHFGLINLDEDDASLLDGSLLDGSLLENPDATMSPAEDEHVMGDKLNSMGTEGWVDEEESQNPEERDEEEENDDESEQSEVIELIQSERKPIKKSGDDSKKRDKRRRNASETRSLQLEERSLQLDGQDDDEEVDDEEEFDEEEDAVDPETQKRELDKQVAQVFVRNPKDGMSISTIEIPTPLIIIPVYQEEDEFSVSILGLIKKPRSSRRRQELSPINQGEEIVGIGATAPTAPTAPVTAERLKKGKPSFLGKFRLARKNKLAQ